MESDYLKVMIMLNRIEIFHKLETAEEDSKFLLNLIHYNSTLGLTA